MTNKILVTGASGFVGRYCIPPLLAAGFEVHAIGRSPSPSSSNITFHSIDIFDVEAVQAKLQALKPSHLLHSAWLATPGVFWTSSDNIRWLTATINLVQAFAEAGGRRMLGIGSCAEYDWSTGGVCTESTTLMAPSTIYGKCKLAAFQALSALSAIHDFSYAWGRLFFPYGVGEPANKFTSAVILSLLQGDTVQCSHGRQVRDFLYIEDVADAIVALLLSPATGDFNIASGQPLSLRDIVDEITLKIGGRELVQFGSRPVQPGEPSVLIANTRHLFEAVNWRPKIDLSSGIDRMLKVLSTTNVVSKTT